MKQTHIILLFLILLLGTSPAFGRELPGSLDIQFGGHLKLKNSASWYDSATSIRQNKDNPFYDGSANLRLNTEAFAGDHFSLKIHYQAELSGGQTRKEENDLNFNFDELGSYALSNPQADDQTSLFDLTRVIEEEDEYIVLHKLDRLSVTYQPSWGMLRLGRQAITWGNGLTFNPMDLFNPFSPTAIDKEYKTGDDMAYCQFFTERFGEWQLLYVPRRDPTDHDPKWKQSSLAAKMDYYYRSLEFDLMLAKHYQDQVAGLGLSGYLKNAAWRLDSTWTFLDKDSQKDGFLSLVANIDYSWTWWEKNFYGFVEFYHNGLGTSDYKQAVTDKQILTRIARGETFVLGKNYLSGQIRMEAHPLVNIYLTIINNLHDPSGIVQPRITWEATQNTKFTLGSDLYYGDKGTEFGGISAPKSNNLLKPANSVYLWVNFYF